MEFLELFLPELAADLVASHRDGPPRLPVLAARQGIVNVFLLNTVHFGASDIQRVSFACAGGWRSDDRRDTRGVLSALGATVFAVTPEAALRCLRQQRH